MTKIAVIGEYFTDVYHIGVARGLSAEAPIPVVDIVDVREFPGGAGNVVANVRSLGAAADGFHSHPNTRKNRLMVGDHQLARWDENDRQAPIATTPNLEEYHGIIISDYGKGGFTPNVIKDLAIEAGLKPVFIDTKQDPFLYSPFYRPFFFPNLTEYRTYRSSYEDLENVVLKRGAEGLQLGDIKLKAVAKRVVSVNGAGDTVIAAFAVNYLRDYDAIGALHAARLASAIAVEKPYTTAVTQQDIAEWVNNGPLVVR